MKRRDFLAAPVFSFTAPALARLGPLLPGDAEVPLPEGGVKFQQRLHQDFITYAPGIEYFMLGNGDIQAVIQYSPDRKGDLPETFLGFTIFDPDRLGRKWSTFLFHPERGFDRTPLSVIVGERGVPLTPENFSSVRWTYPRSIPSVQCEWKAETIGVVERFFVPAAGGFLFRDVTLENRGTAPADVKLYAALVPNFGLFDEIGPDESTRTVRARGFASMTLQSLDGDVNVSGRYDMTVAPGPILPGKSARIRLVYSIDPSAPLLDAPAYDRLVDAAESWWRSRSSVRTENQVLDHLFGVSRTGLRAMLARTGKRDSGTWMYNMEWVRDDVMVAIALLQAGMDGEAKTLVTKLLEKSVGADGRTFESSRWSGFDYTELDQNGELLYALWVYASWTGDLEFVKKYWKSIAHVAGFPLQERFRDRETGLMHNRREFWERNDSFGVEDGYELTYQFWVSFGLAHAADLADAVGAPEGKQWRETAEAIRASILTHPKYRLVEEGHFIKRRTRGGVWQRFMVPPDPSRMPPGSPMATNAKPECEPDLGNVIPVMYGFVEPESDIALGTLRHCETLWSQKWDFGGYPRYNTSSEPDPPAPWPLATLFMARSYVETGDGVKFWKCVNWVRNIHGGLSGGWFERYGPSITPPAPPVCVIGWAWAEVTSLMIHHIAGVRPGLDALTIRPRLPQGVDRLTASFRVRGAPCDLTVRRTQRPPSARVDGKSARVSGGVLMIPYADLNPGGMQGVTRNITIDMEVS
jgi:hypothetical protein